MTKEEILALRAKAAGQSSTKRMMVVTPSGNTIVREFPADKIPARWMREGVEMQPGDVVPQSTSPGRSMLNITKRSVADVLPDAANVAPMAIPGAGPARIAARAGLGLLLGSSADAGQRALRGQPQNPQASAMAGGLNAGVQLTGDLVPPWVASRAEPLAKMSLGNSLPGMEKTLLEAKTPVSNAGLEADQQFIDAQLQKAKTAIAGWRGQFSSAQIRRELRAHGRSVSRNDVLSTAEEEAVSNALRVFQSKQGGGTQVTPSNLVNQFGAQLPPTVTRIPSKRLTAQELDGINHFAETEAKKLYEARIENKVRTPGDLENAYKKLADVTNKMLNTIPEVAAANHAVHVRIGLKNAKFDALKRSTGGRGGLATLAGIEGGHLGFTLTHNPAAALAALPIGAATYAGTTPQGLSRLAFLASSPTTERVLRAGPRIALGAAQRFMDRKQPSE